jgi:methylenetetrahydrofolate dehydrogenase (NADP+)/methenyltetrahydrofolate cyclohydrolase
MAAIVINGNAVAAAVRREWKGRAEALKRRGVLPALAVVIAGDSLASKIYVRNKVKACCEVGLHSEVLELPTDIGEDMVLARIRRLNHNRDIHASSCSCHYRRSSTGTRSSPPFRRTRTSTGFMSTTWAPW